MSAEELLTREQTKAIADRVLALSNADETRVTIASSWSGNTRFADSSITTSGGMLDVTVTVTVTIGRRRASATTNALDDGSLKRTVELAASLARLSPDDPELMPELGPQAYGGIAAFVETTANLDPEQRNAAIKRAVDSGTAAGKAAGQIFTAGFLQANAAVFAVATSKGLFAFHRATDANFSMTSRTPDATGSGWASAGARDWNKVDPAAVGRISVQKAVASRNPQSIAPGLYTAVLEPQAVNDLVPLLENALNARSADEGRSAFARPGGNRIGEKVMDERVTLYSDPADPSLLGRPFDDEGLPIGRTVWVDKGVLTNLIYSRFWAQKQGKVPTGDAFNAGGLALTGGTATTEQIIAGCRRGILVTHFFYIRSLEPRTVLFTGLTRDGVFLIEDGKITRALKNFRWNESPLLMLNRLEDLGRPEPVATGAMMPALRVRDFNFTSSSDAV